MEAIKLTQVVETDGEIVVKGLPWRKGQRVELTLMPGSAPSDDEQLGMTARELARSTPSQRPRLTSLLSPSARPGKP